MCQIRVGLGIIFIIIDSKLLVASKKGSQFIEQVFLIQTCTKLAVLRHSGACASMIFTSRGAYIAKIYYSYIIWFHIIQKYYQIQANAIDICHYKHWLDILNKSVGISILKYFWFSMVKLIIFFKYLYDYELFCSIPRSRPFSITSRHCQILKREISIIK